MLSAIVIGRRIVASPVGLIWVAIRENPLRAAAVGHNVHAYKLLAFVIAAAYSGAAGGLLGVMQGYMPPDAFTFETSGQIIMMTVIGGLETLFGPLVGAAVWLYLRDFLQGGLGLALHGSSCSASSSCCWCHSCDAEFSAASQTSMLGSCRGRATALREPAAPDLSLDEFQPPRPSLRAPLPTRPIPAY